ncbi:MAG: hypothetical protein Q3992_02500 [Bacteroides sp.]|nr:hypothetical protein [Bacteroides sp.]
MRGKNNGVDKRKFEVFVVSDLGLRSKNNQRVVGEILECVVSALGLRGKNNKIPSGGESVGDFYL